MTEPGALALIPVATILVVAVFTRRTLLAMVAGTLIGTVLLGGRNFFESWVAYFNASLADDTLQWLVLVVVLFGILIALLERSGAVGDFAAWAALRVTSRRKSLVMSFLLTIVLFVDDYLSSLTVGTSMKAVTDRYRVPRTQLGTIIKMAAAPACVLIPFSTWALFFSGLLEESGVTTNGTGFGAYIESIPLIFFGWISVTMSLLLALGLLPLIGPLKTANLRAHATGETLPATLTEGERKAEDTCAVTTEDDRPRPYNFLIPIITMIAVTLTTGVDILTGTTAALVVAIVLYLAQRTISFTGVAEAAFGGVTSMSFVIVLSVLAFMVQHMNVDLALATYIIDATTPFMNGAWLPAIVFLVCGVYAYATGSFWDLAAVITPVVIPLALAMEVNPILAGAAVFSGAALGSTTCLYGDGIILAAKSTGVKPLHLMLTILPYAGVAMALSFVLYVIAGFISVNT
ncbi:Na+/H+ antiporter NhaC family protein [Klugiella xanthotipulae]|uniref:Transporter (NhaC family) n=1 Tax=Klugiella xanthotipulae TaxID=244735 RepID=A0A543HTB3_9MICO|nr:Na+/H+ antiporter NhaC family protein [Klugiella xanthotipulae]TQM61548.1 transporter (NhaC family) [Klugiella xanthotipulae]